MSNFSKYIKAVSAPAGTCDRNVYSTGQDVSYATGDDVNIGDDFWLVNGLNHFGHSFRFCGIDGGYTDGVNYYDVNGVATTKALAFPDGLICDLGYVDCNNDFTMYQDSAILSVNQIWTSAITYCNSFTLGSFTSGWRMPTRNEMSRMFYQKNSYCFAHKPWESVSTVSLFWTSTTFPFAGSSTRVWRFNQYQEMDFIFKTGASGRPFPVRTTNISEL